MSQYESPQGVVGDCDIDVLLQVFPDLDDVQLSVLLDLDVADAMRHGDVWAAKQKAHPV